MMEHVHTGVDTLTPLSFLARSARVFGELYEKFPTGPRSERAAWKYGWWSYRNGDHDSAIKTFESAASAFPRSDYRPSYLDWSARAHARLGHGETAGARFRLVYQDYGSSYYGRLAQRRVERRPGQPEADRRQLRIASACSSPTVCTMRRLRSCAMRSGSGGRVRPSKRRSPGPITRRGICGGRSRSCAAPTRSR